MRVLSWGALRGRLRLSQRASHELDVQAEQVGYLRCAVPLSTKCVHPLLKLRTVQLIQVGVQLGVGNLLLHGLMAPPRMAVMQLHR
jgi:hypothetical protein